MGELKDNTNEQEAQCVGLLEYSLYGQLSILSDVRMPLATGPPTVAKVAGDRLSNACATGARMNPLRLAHVNDWAPSVSRDPRESPRRFASRIQRESNLYPYTKNAKYVQNRHGRCQQHCSRPKAFRHNTGPCGKSISGNRYRHALKLTTPIISSL